MLLKINELKTAQKQLLKLMEKKDEAKARAVKNGCQNEVTGKFGTAIELLVTFAKENEEDTKEIKQKVHGLVDDLEATEREIQLQEAMIRRKK